MSRERGTTVIDPVIRRFLGYATIYGRQIFLAIVGMLLVAIGTSGSAWLVKPMLDEIFINKDLAMLTLVPIGIILAYAAKGIGRYIQTYYTNYIGQDILRRLRDELLSTLISLDLAFHRRHHSGELISRLTNDVNRVQQIVANMLPDLVREGITAIALLVVVISMSPKLAFYALIVMPLAIIPLAKLAKKMKRLSKATQLSISDLTARLSEIFSNLEIIKANATETFEKARFAATNRDYFRLTMKSVRTNELTSPLMEILIAIGVAAVVTIGGREVINGTLTVGSFFSFSTALVMLYTPIKKITQIHNKMQEAIASGERIFEILDERPTIVSGPYPLIEPIRRITFDKVTLAYGNHIALRDISLEVLVGEKIALVGDSGGGKSSLVALLVRFYDPTEGRVLLNDRPISDYTLESLRKKIAMVTQRIFIFNDTVAANVAYGEEPDEARIEKALKEANAWEFVSNLPQGIYTVLEEAGSNLSGGQRQRIAIARALYKEPELLILDEATSALDNTSEAAIQEALARLTEGKITFVIAHRLSTIRDCHRIVVLKRGRILDIGSHDELLQRCEEYRHLNRKLT
ncbi:MAG: ABC transporter ATP-binding protein/permease [Campylobacterales bacterium]